MQGAQVLGNTSLSRDNALGASGTGAAVMVEDQPPTDQVGPVWWGVRTMDGAATLTIHRTLDGEGVTMTAADARRLAKWVDENMMSLQ